MCNRFEQFFQKLQKYNVWNMQNAWMIFESFLIKKRKKKIV